MEKTWLEITSRVPCSLNCSYCPQKNLFASYAKLGGPNCLTFDNYVKYIETVPSDVLIVFAGFSEPFLSKDIVDIMSFTQKKGHKMTLATTFVGITKDKLKNVSEINFENITVHLPQKYMQNIKIPQSYIDILIEAGKLFCNQDLTFTYFDTIPNNVAEILNNFKIVKRNLIDRAGNLDDFGTKYSKRGKIDCALSGETLSQNILLPNGKVALCCMDYSLKHIIGDLSKDTYKDIFQSKEYKKVIKGTKDETIPIICRNCYRAVIDNNYKASLFMKLKYKAFLLLSKKNNT